MEIELGQYGDLAVLFLRWAIAAVFIYHALPKIKNAKGMSRVAGMPTAMVFVLGIIELAASLGMILGVYVQVSALLLAAVMIGAIYFKAVKWRVPFSAMDKTGWEFDLILLAVSLFLLVSGGGGIGIK